MRFKSLLKLSFLCFSITLLVNCKEQKPTTSEDKVVVSFKKEGILHLKKSNSDSIIKTIDISFEDIVNTFLCSVYIW